MGYVRGVGLLWLVLGVAASLIGYTPGPVNGLLFSGATLTVTGSLLLIYSKLDEILRKLK